MYSYSEHISHVAATNTVSIRTTNAIKFHDHNRWYFIDWYNAKGAKRHGGYYIGQPTVKAFDHTSASVPMNINNEIFDFDFLVKATFID